MNCVAKDANANNESMTEHVCIHASIHASLKRFIRYVIVILHIKTDQTIFSEFNFNAEHILLDFIYTFITKGIH